MVQEISNWGFFGPFWPFLVKKGHFRWSDGYTLYETLIGNLSFRLKWGVYHVRTTNRSGGIDLGNFEPFWPKKARKGHFRGHIILFMLFETWISSRKSYAGSHLSPISVFYDEPLFTSRVLADLAILAKNAWNNQIFYQYCSKHEFYNASYILGVI